MLTGFFDCLNAYPIYPYLYKIAGTYAILFGFDKFGLLFHWMVLDTYCCILLSLYDRSVKQ